MIFVTSQEKLAMVFGNDIMVVEGETTPFEKIALELASSEDWLISQIVGDTTANEMTEDTPIFNACVTIVGCDALRRSIPALDLVLTPNGFGIVQDKNVVPASKERVERLISSCITRRDYAIERLYKMLAKQASWQDSEQRRFWASSPLQEFMLVDGWNNGKKYDSRYEAFLAMRNEAAPFVTKLAERYISSEVMKRISLAVCSMGDSEDDRNDRETCANVAYIILRHLNGHPFKHQLIDPIVNCLRENDDDWKNSSVAAYYAEAAFKNVKDSKGYWF